MYHQPTPHLVMARAWYSSQSELPRAPAPLPPSCGRSAASYAARSSCWRHGGQEGRTGDGSGGDSDASAQLRAPHPASRRHERGGGCAGVRELET